MVAWVYEMNEGPTVRRQPVVKRERGVRARARRYIEKSLYVSVKRPIGESTRLAQEFQGMTRPTSGSRDMQIPIPILQKRSVLVLDPAAPAR